MIISENHSNYINAPVRSIVGKVELYNGSTLLNTYKHTDALKSFSVERVGDTSKFFGFGVCQKLKVKLIDRERTIDITTANSFTLAIGSVDDYIYTFPAFHVSEVRRDENTNELSITAYDALYKAEKHTVSELGLDAPYSIKSFAMAIASFLGLPASFPDVLAFDKTYNEGANFDGSESLREALNAIAEATQTIYFINHDWQLTFKRLDIEGAAVLEIDKSKYFTLDSGENKRLGTITHATELGDNVSASTSATGSTQFIRNNPFWDLQEDIAQLVEDALAVAGGLTINQFSCSWRGNYLVEIGDKIALTTKDDATVYSFLLDDVISYDGALSQQTQWQYSANDAETASNPTTIGDAIKQTYARVDKANKQIELVASETASNNEAISSLRLNTESISASVSKVEADTNSALEAVNSDIATISKRVEASVNAEQVSIAIKNELANGVSKVETSTGFTFNDTGLTVSKSNSEIETQITEDGMKVYKNNEAVLTANNEGVKAVDLHATTYLIIGTNSRFEDFGTNRTGCFWIGG